LAARHNVISRLQTLTEKDVLRIREVFAKHRHTRFMKSFSGHLPFGTKDAYVKEIMVADLGKLAGLIRICGFLMQTKTYLFWSKKHVLKTEKIRSLKARAWEPVVTN